MKAETKNMFKGAPKSTDFSAIDDAKNSLDSALRDDFSPESFAEERMSSPALLRSIYGTMLTDDYSNSGNRAKVQAMVDYKPPYNQKTLDQLGRGSQFNINFGEGAASVNNVVNNYLDIFTNPASLIKLPIKQGYGTPIDRQKWSDIISNEYARMVRGWDESQFTFLELVQQFVTHGVGFSSLRPGDDWRWSAGGLSEFKVPSRSKATSSSIQIIASEEQMEATTLYGNIKNEAEAVKKGWNPEAVRSAIVNAARAGDNKYNKESPEQIEERIKAHDFDTASPTASVKIINARVEEYDGTISHYICSDLGPDDGNGKITDNWLFRKKKAYKSMSEAVQIFPFFTGNNGNIHTIRGLGHIVFPQVQGSNLLQCGMMDSARDAMATTYVVNTEQNLDTLPIIHAGSARLIPSTLQIAENQHSPDLSRTAIPAMNLLKEQLNRMSSASSMASTLTEGSDRRSKFEVSAAIEYLSAITAAAMRLFMRPWRQLLSNSARRAFTSPASGADFGVAAGKMRAACVARGVPEEVLKNGIDFDLAMVDVPLGLGDKAAKEAIFAKGAELLPYMDDAGRRRFAALKAINLFGEENAAYLVPLDGVERPPIDAKVAEMENNQLSIGLPISIDNGEDFMVHLKIHIQWLWQIHQAVEEGEIELTEAVMKMKPVYDHAVETFSVAQVPDESVAELNNAKQALQQIGEIVSNGLKAIQKQQRQQQEQQQEQPQGGEEQSSNDSAMVKAQADAQIKIMQAELSQQIKTQDHELKMALAQQKSEHEIMIKTMEAAQDRALKDLDSTSKIKRTP